MTRPPFGAHLALAEALRERYPGRILLHATSLFGPGLQALHERAEELLGRADPEDVLAELRRVEREGRLIHITRGVGNLYGVRFWCRPQVSLLVVG